MCVETWRKYQQCGHKIRMSKYTCNDALGRARNADNTLTRTKFLPDRPSKQSPPPKPCATRTAISPYAEYCPDCEKARKARPAHVPQSPSAGSTQSQGQQSSGSQSTRAVDRVRSSLLFLEQQRKTSG
ncbi:hypothetical protein GGR52DRAFT_58063 [Hypoxylon sp. FL1284]|nr:hypothetical protein GGR52DRAFT_58063 [Hypoxylon sp. FL1284]